MSLIIPISPNRGVRGIKQVYVSKKFDLRLFFKWNGTSNRVDSCVVCLASRHISIDFYFIESVFLLLLLFFFKEETNN